jgi:hypothetical protein
MRRHWTCHCPVVVMCHSYEVTLPSWMHGISACVLSVELYYKLMRFLEDIFIRLSERNDMTRPDHLRTCQCQCKLHVLAP